jgi:hypothetical protein
LLKWDEKPEGEVGIYIEMHPIPYTFLSGVNIKVISDKAPLSP